MSDVRIDITGQTFGLLKVVRYEGNRKRFALWLCVCTCEAERVCRGTDLRRGRITACFDCTRQKKNRRIGEKMKGRRPHNAGVSNASLRGRLTPAGLMEYARWEAACKRLDVFVTPVERAQVLRELIEQ